MLLRTTLAMIAAAALVTACAGAVPRADDATLPPVPTSSVVGVTVPNSVASVATTPPSASQCVLGAKSENPDDVLANIYRFRPHDAVELPADLTWAENPVGDPNWEFQLHSLRFVGWLIAAWQDGGDRRYLDRAVLLMQDWLADNPPGGGPSAFSWNDHATAQRAKILACAAEETSGPWMTEALLLHGETLADPDFYVEVGNHAFQQGIGLLAVGCTVGDSDWIDLALDRISEVVTQSVDAQGVTNEQSVQYQLYNYRLYGEAYERFAACGVEAPPGFEHVELMPEFLAHATMPNGQYVLLGDTEVRSASRIGGTVASFAATMGAHGPQPDSNVAIYEAGFLFARTGWGEEQPIADEVYLSARFGPPPFLHGHADGGSLTLYGYGSRLIVDPGKYTYARGEWRDYFAGQRAHNVVIVDGQPAADGVETELVSSAVTDDFISFTLQRTIADGVSWKRRVVFSMNGFVVVDDLIDGAAGSDVTQLWHLPDDANPVVSDNVVATRRSHGNVAILQLGSVAEITTITGDHGPIQGWMSDSYLKLLPSPTVMTTTTSVPARFVTVLYPSATGLVPQVSAAIDSDRLDITIDAEDYTEVIRIDGEEVTIARVR